MEKKQSDFTGYLAPDSNGGFQSFIGDGQLKVLEVYAEEKNEKSYMIIFLSPSFYKNFCFP